MKRDSYFICVLILLSCSGSKDVMKEEWLSLFNGKNLAGWDIKIAGQPVNDNYKNTFRVENGILRVSYDQYQNFDNKYGHIYYKHPFSYYRLKIEYRFVGEQIPGGETWNVRNSGVMIHSQGAETLSVDQGFPVSLEAQFLGGLSDGQPRTTANLCTPGTMVEMDGKLNTEHCINSKSKTYDGDQWVTVELVVLGDSLIQHKIGGEVVLEFNKPIIGEVGEYKNYFLGEWGAQHEGEPLKEGYIALQAESHSIEFKKVELLNLKGCKKPECKNYKTYYVVQGECECNGGSN